MKAILENSLAPLTLSIGFLKAPLPSVCEAYLMWKRPHFQSIDSSDIDSDFPSALRELEPLTIPPRRILLISTESQWTAYFDNGSRGPDAFPPISYLAQQLGCLGLVVTCIPHTLTTELGQGRGTYGAVRFDLFGPVQTNFLNCQRSISVAYDGGKWRFDAEGSIQPFEEIEKYSSRRILDRFTPEMLESYCGALGIRVFDDTFYKAQGKLITIHDPLPFGAKEITLEEARQQLAFA